MNDTPRNNTNHDTTIEWQHQDDAAQLRALADGELPGDAEAALRVKLGDEAVDRAAGFETVLRERCGMCMAGEPAPDELRDRVVLLLNDDATDVLSRPAPGFWTGGGRALMGLAAVVALAATVWIIASTGSDSSKQFLQQATQHIAGEHSGCELNPESFEAKSTQLDSDEKPEEYIAEKLGGLPVHLELDQAEYTLTGIGGCHLPGPGKSVHLLYEPTDEAATYGSVSLFIQNASEDDKGLIEGVVYTNGSDHAPYVRIWREGRAVYYMATSCPVGRNKVESAYALTGKRIPL